MRRPPQPDAPRPRRAERRGNRAAARNTVILLVVIAIAGAAALYASLAHLSEVAAIGAADPDAGMRALVRFVRLVAGLALLVLVAGGATCVWRGLHLRGGEGGGGLRGRALVVAGVFLVCLGAAGLVLGGL